MLVEFYTWDAKPGRRSDLVEWIKELVEREYKPKDITTRIYKTNIGTWGRVIMEVEFETMDDRQKYWAGVELTPEFNEFIATHNDMILSDAKSELLVLC